MGANEKAAATYHPAMSETDKGLDLEGVAILRARFAEHHTLHGADDRDPRFMGAGTPEHDHTGERGE